MKKLLLVVLLIFSGEQLCAGLGDAIATVVKVGVSLTALHVVVALANATAIAREEYADPRGFYHYKPEELSVVVHPTIQSLYKTDKELFMSIASSMKDQTTFVGTFGLMASCIPVVGLVPGVLCAARAHGLAAETIAYAQNPNSFASIARRAELSTHRAAHEIEKIVDPRYRF